MSEKKWYIEQLEDTHDQLLRYIQEKKKQNSIVSAKTLETYLQRLFQYFRAPVDPMALGIMPLSSDIEQQLEFELGIPKNLFNFLDSQNINDFEKGNLFEKNLSETIMKLLEINVPIQVGQNKVTSNMLIDLNQTSLHWNLKVQVPKEVNKGINEFIEMNVKEARKKGYKTAYLASASGVIDINVPQSKKTLTYQPLPFLNTLNHLLRGANITAKCYTNTNQIHLGNSNLLRIITSIYDVLGKSQAETSKIYKIFNSRNSNLKNMVRQKEYQKHLSHYTYVYQILGAGQYIDIEGKLQPLSTTNYLIVFDRKANTVFVRSTLELAEKYMFTNLTARKPYINLARGY